MSEGARDHIPFTVIQRGSLLLEQFRWKASHWYSPSSTFMTGYMFRVLLPGDRRVLAVRFRLWLLKIHRMDIPASSVRQVRTRRSLSKTVVLMTRMAGCATGPVETEEGPG